VRISLQSPNTEFGLQIGMIFIDKKKIITEFNNEYVVSELNQSKINFHAKKIRKVDISKNVREKGFLGRSYKKKNNIVFKFSKASMKLNFLAFLMFHV
jgi:type IV secretory pathway component VirB8